MYRCKNGFAPTRKMLSKTMMFYTISNNNIIITIIYVLHMFHITIKTHQMSISHSSLISFEFFKNINDKINKKSVFQNGGRCDIFILSPQHNWLLGHFYQLLHVIVQIQCTFMQCDYNYYLSMFLTLFRDFIWHRRPWKVTANNFAAFFSCLHYNFFVPFEFKVWN